MKISIRTELRSGDLGYLIFLHGDIYRRENGYNITFECYVAEGLVEFYKQYDPAKNRVWICEHQNKMIGFVLLMNRGELRNCATSLSRRNIAAWVWEKINESVHGIPETLSI